MAAALITNILTPAGQELLLHCKSRNWNVFSIERKRCAQPDGHAYLCFVEVTDGNRIIKSFSELPLFHLVIYNENIPFQIKSKDDFSNGLHNYMQSVVKVTHRLLLHSKMDDGSSMVIAPANHSILIPGSYIHNTFFSILGEWSDQLSDQYEHVGVRVCIQLRSATLMQEPINFRILNN